MQTKMVRVPLLKRLLGYPQKQVQQNHAALFVMEALGYLLNARMGVVLAEHDYGLPDVALLVPTSAELIHLLERNIFELVQHYEPRLQQLRVRGAWDAEFPERLHFSIQAHLFWQEEGERVHYQSVLLPGGRVMLKAA